MSSLDRILPFLRPIEDLLVDPTITEVMVNDGGRHVFVERDGALIMVDDDRMKLRDGEVIENRIVRFRTLGCYPLTGAIDSDATDLGAIVQEMLIARTSERQGRMIDKDEAGSMEKKKREGYF